MPIMVSSGPQILLNCLVLGEHPDYIFQVNIARTETVGVLKEVIKETRKPAFDNVDAHYLKLWKVDLPLDEALESNVQGIEDKIQPPCAAKLFEDPNELPEENRLHIVIQTPPNSASSEPPDIVVNCWILVEPFSLGSMFPVKIAKTETVGTLKEAIRRKRQYLFRDIDTDNVTLALWSVSLPDNDELREKVKNLDLDEVEILPSMLQLLELTFKERHLHIVVKVSSSSELSLSPSLVDVREAYVDQHIERPSEAAIPEEFAELQKRSTHQVFCSRPYGVEDPIPVTLLEPIFAQFVDDCQNYEPTDDDYSFVAMLSHEMCDFYTSEIRRLRRFSMLFEDYGIALHHYADMFDPSQASMDDHVLVGTHVNVILGGRGEIGNGGAEPFAEAMLNYRKYLQFVDDRRNVFKEHKALLPCFQLICIGACFGILGTVFSTKVQCDILVPVIPMFWHSTDAPMEMMAVRTLAALKVAVKRLEDHHTNPTTTVKPLIVDGSIVYPYPRDYVDFQGIQHTFSYYTCQPLRKRLIFYGKITSGPRICVKFTREYSPQAHRFCASKGHAPKLLAYKPLPGGWNMAVMEFIDLHPHLYHPGSYQRFTNYDKSPEFLSMEKSITTLVKELHTEGYVHGDLRSNNILAQAQKDHEGTVICNFQLIDFNWAGPIGEIRYPIGVNRVGIYRPENARGGRRILAEDDLDMLKNIFHPELRFERKRKWDEI